MRILVIEDEIALASTISDFLQSQGHLTEIANNYKTSLDKIEAGSYDCILLDISLPDGNGLDLIDKVKKNQHDPHGLIIISAKNSIDDKVSGLNLGADDYLPKPFHMAELLARVHAVARRRDIDASHIIEFEEIRINTSAKSIFVNTKEISITRKEFDLLLFLVSNKNRVVSKEAIAEHLTGDQADMLSNFDFIYTHIKNLKKKLQDAGSQDYIRSIYGLGYKFTA
jgi:DNA-binding response OmpR family regulator